MMMRYPLSLLFIETLQHLLQYIYTDLTNEDANWAELFVAADKVSFTNDLTNLTIHIEIHKGLVI